MNGRLLTGAKFGGVKVATHYNVECWRLFHDDATACEQPKKCRHKHTPVLMWRDSFHNLVSNAGLDALLNNTFNAAAGAVTWFVGLVGAAAGNVDITSGAASVTGHSTNFVAGLASAPIADIIIVGAGAAGADLVTTVATRSSTTAITTTANAGTTVTGASYATEIVAADTMAANNLTDTTPYSNASRPAWTKNGASSGGAMSNSSSKAVFTINATGRIFGLFLTDSSTKSGTSGTLYGMGLFAGGSRAVQSGDTLNAQVDLSAAAA